MSSVLNKLDEKFEQGKAPMVDRPQRASFKEFLLKDARVPVGSGEYAPYSFEGREALIGIVDTIDHVLGSHSGEPLKDSLLGVAGGAQFGKTILALNLGAYCSSQLFLNFGLYLPDDKLADTVIDTKFRPDVVDQIPWLARMTQVGKAVNESGKQVNTKKAATMTDGRRRANFLVSGLQKPTTTISLDLAYRDEEDDIPPKNAKFVKGRLTNSKYKIQFVIGTQRVNGRGQHKVWKDGSQGVELLGVESEAWQFEPSQTVSEIPGGFINPEENFPGIIRHAVTGVPRGAQDPKLTWAGDFRHDAALNDIVSTHLPTNVYYLAHPVTGEPLNRFRPVWHHRKPERIVHRNWTWRLSQLGIGALGLTSIVGQFTLAVSDPEEMVVFRCDVLGMPESTSQPLTPKVIARSRELDPFEMRVVREPGRACFAGLDVGDKSWLYVREIESPERKRLIYATSMPIADMVNRVGGLFSAGLFDVLFIDQRPSVNEARQLALIINGLSALENWPTVPKPGDAEAHVALPGGLTWNGRTSKWQNLKCAVVRFDKKQIGQGIEQAFDQFSENGLNKFVPLIRCNREETIDRAVREFLTPTEGVNDVVSGKIRLQPSMLLPIGKQPIHALVESHLMLGSERIIMKDNSLGDYVDQVANHLLLANGYSALAEQEVATKPVAPFEFDSIPRASIKKRRVV